MIIEVKQHLVALVLGWVTAKTIMCQNVLPPVRLELTAFRL